MTVKTKPNEKGQINMIPERQIEQIAPAALTPWALFVEGAPGFTLSVQWHPEYNAASDPVSRPLFEAFGDAARAWAASRAGIGAKALSA